MLDWIVAQRKRILMSFFGVIISGMCVGFMKVGAFGVDPFQALMAGLDSAIPIQFGTLYVIVNAVMLIFSLVTDRHNVGVATFINLFLLGYVVDFTKAGLDLVFPAPSMPIRIGCMLFGIVMLCFASSLYMTASLGISTYDSVAVVMSGKWKLGRFKYVRICTDLGCVILGAVLYLASGGKLSGIPAFIGVGTIITAFFMGPLIEFFNEKVARPMLNGK